MATVLTAVDATVHPVQRDCPECGTAYEADPARLKHGRQMTCSRACSYRMRGRAMRAAVKNPSPPPHPNAWRIYYVDCAVCRAVKVVRDAEDARTRKFCSKVCFYVGRELRATFGTGPEHPNWKGGITDEDKAERVRFIREIKPLVIARDGGCVLCRATENLHVDHLKSWSACPELRFDPDNCRTLCAPCHYAHTYGRQMPDSARRWGNGLTKVG